MPNGKPGDHPRTDLLIHNIEVYGKETDGLLRKLLKYLPDYAFDEWFNDYWTASKEEVHEAVKKKLEVLEKEAKDKGWEIS